MSAPTIAPSTSSPEEQPVDSLAEEMDNMSVASTRRCHLLELPMELKEHIFELALYPQPVGQRTFPVHHIPNRLELPSSDYHGYEISQYARQQYQPPALLHTCRQTRNEASAFFYKRSVFWKLGASKNLLDTACGLQDRWCKSLRPEDRKLVSSIRIEFGGVSSPESRSALFVDTAQRLLDRMGGALDDEMMEVLRLPIWRGVVGDEYGPVWESIKAIQDAEPS